MPVMYKKGQGKYGHYEAGGKGQARRHKQITEEEFSKRWDKIFGKGKETKDDR